MKYLSFLLIFISLISCSPDHQDVENALTFAKENRKELEQVLAHYKKDPADSLKYKAAIFLIRNMPSYSFSKQMDGFDKAFDSISKYPLDGTRRGVFEKILDPIAKGLPRSFKDSINDVQYIDSGSLINNIDLAFEAWHRIPFDKRATFDEFCNYILPYRNYDEPLERNTRNQLFKEYSWVYDSLKRTKSIKPIVDSIIAAFHFRYMLNIRDLYPVPLSISQLQKSKLGLCQDAVNYFVNLFRSLGIICANDLIPQWGDHYAFGHSWVYIKYGAEEYATDIDSGGVDMRVKYIGESIPKIYRRTFAPSAKPDRLFDHVTDVTSFYTPTANFSIKIDSTPKADISSSTYYTLNVFNAYTDWNPVSQIVLDNDHLICKDIGVNVLYIAGYWKENMFTPLSYPFYLNKEKNIHFFKPVPALSDSVPLLRKYGLSTVRNRNKVNWILSLNGGLLQASNTPDFKRPVTLFEIKNFWSTQLQKISLHPDRRYKFVRFYSNKKVSFLAELLFLNEKGDTLKGKIIEKDLALFTRSEAAFDHNPLTYCGGKNFYIGYELPRPEEIGQIALQVRNDDNHVRKGDLYNLYYWDKKWISLGQKKAKDTILYYNGVPKNSLLRLSDISGGIEEHVFKIDENSNQFWFGFDNYPHTP
jgi:hypothetical protein